ncbi:MAG: AtpZ/AtpI family protein [Alkalilacustris sp.]
MGDMGERERLRQLGERIARLKGDKPDGPTLPDKHSQGQMAWRMVTELVAGLLVGFGIGYGLDVLFGTQPWFLVSFALLGFAAGVQTMMRTARDMQRRLETGADSPRDDADSAGPKPATHKTAGPTPAEGQEEDARRG